MHRKSYVLTSWPTQIGRGQSPQPPVQISVRAILWRFDALELTSNGVNIGATNTAALNSNVNVAVLEWLQFELLLLEILPILLVLDHEALGGIWVAHLECSCLIVWRKRKWASIGSEEIAHTMQVLL